MFPSGFVDYKKGCTRLAAPSDKVYQLLAHGRWFSAGTAASSITKTGRHDKGEILLKVALSTINQIDPGKIVFKRHTFSHTFHGMLFIIPIGIQIFVY